MAPQEFTRPPHDYECVSTKSHSRARHKFRFGGHHAREPLGLGSREVHELFGILRRVEELGGLTSPANDELPRPLDQPELRLLPGEHWQA